MKLFLASEIKHPNTVEKLNRYLNGLADKSIAYIPTAANGEGWGSWRSGGSWEMVQKQVANVTLVQLEEYCNGGLEGVLRGKDIIWMAGGYCAYLLYWIGRTRLDEMLPSLLQKSIYVGSSAGSMITAAELPAAEWYLEERLRGVQSIPGLNLVNFTIYPHFSDTKRSLIKKMYQGNSLYLLKDGEHIVVEDNKIQIVGHERIIHSRKG